MNDPAGGSSGGRTGRDRFVHLANADVAEFGILALHQCHDVRVGHRVQVNGCRGWNPAISVRAPEDLAMISFGVEVIAAYGAAMAHHVFDLIAGRADARVELADGLQAVHTQGDLLNGVEVVSVGSSTHERDLVIGTPWITAQKHHAPR